MYDSVLKFTCRTTNLDRTEEFWQCDTSDDRYDTIMKDIVKVTGLSASKNMKPIREGVFLVNDDTTIDDLRKLAELIRKQYKIDCFQIAIERPSNTVHMLFDFNDRETAKSIVLNRSQHIALSAMILRCLHLPRPECSEQWLFKFLKERINVNPATITILLDKLDRSKLGEEDVGFIRDALNYVKLKCVRPYQSD